MATLVEVGELVTKQLRERVERLEAAIADDAPDFADVSRLADAVGEFADTIAGIYGDLEQTLMSGLPGGSTSGGEGDDSEQGQQTSPRRERRSENTQGNGSTEDATKDELLERAREMNVEGRSSMSKEELAQAVDAEEAVTKEELLERAREAEIEGRSSMTKDELRDALNDAHT